MYPSISLFLCFVQNCVLNLLGKVEEVGSAASSFGYGSFPVLGAPLRPERAAVVTAASREAPIACWQSMQEKAYQR
jgi:hypothetical protein